MVCNDGDIRVQSGANAREGRVEICNRQAWGTVCDDLWDTVDAGVACTQLGYAAAGKLTTSYMDGYSYAFRVTSDLAG